MATFNELINSEVPVLVDFYAEWCGPCKQMEPMLQELAGKIEGKAKILKVNVDHNAKATQKYEILGVPTLILFKNGKILWRQSGVVPMNELEQVIRQNL
jgi:thioredoxin 1